MDRRPSTRLRSAARAARRRAYRPTALVPALALAVAALAGMAGAQQEPAPPDRSAPPPPGPPPSLQLPPVQRLETSNGLPVFLVEKHEVPLAQVDLMVRAGSANDPADRPGLAGFTGAMLDEGAGGRGALELADAVEYLGARLGVTVEEHTTTAALHVPRARLAEALPLLADVVLRPDFPAEELERQRVSRLTTLMQWRDEPAQVAAVVFQEGLYGEEHPYGRTALGTEAALRAVGTDDLRSFHAAWFRPNNAALIAVGDVTAEALMPLLEQAFGSWEPGTMPRAKWPAASQVGGREILLVDKPGAAQSEIRVGRIGVERDTEDYFPLVVMNTILGGSFGSRLNQNLRERNGFTYGARSGFDFRIHPGPFTARAAVQTDVTDKALVEFVRELEAIVAGVTDEELARAKSYVALRYPASFQTVEQVAGHLEEMVEFGLPADYFNRYVQRVLAVSKTDVERVARAAIDPKNVLVVVVGDREKVEPGLRALDLGSVRTLTIEDVFGPPPALEPREEDEGG